jgi:MerR family transcriptional regulator, copper efflux regulator
MDRVIIGKVAKQAQVRIETLRYYERIGLVAPPLRNGSNYRLYPEETVQRVRFIKRAQELGFSLKEIRELLALQATPETSCADIRTRAFDKITAIDDKIRVLHAMKHALTQLVAECSGQGEITDCPILASLDEGDNYGNQANR